MNFFYTLIITIGCAFISNAQPSSRTQTAVVGDPLILNFKDDDRVDHVYTKDGKVFKADNYRIFQRFGNIYFSRVLESDIGTYRLVEGEFDKSITLVCKLLKHITACI